MWLLGDMPIQEKGCREKSGIRVRFRRRNSVLKSQVCMLSVHRKLCYHEGITTFSAVFLSWQILRTSSHRVTDSGHSSFLACFSLFTIYKLHYFVAEFRGSGACVWSLFLFLKYFVERRILRFLPFFAFLYYTTKFSIMFSFSIVVAAFPVVFFPKWMLL